MKLIDILVQELPKLGGWPDGIDDIEMLSDGTIYFNGDIAPDNYKLTQCSDGWSRLKSAKDYSNAVTREQYEAALAANKPVWDGEGLPNIGCEIEVNSPRYGWKVAVVTAITDSWIVAKYSDGVEFAGCHRSLEGNKGWADNHSIFRPIRSEVDKKRENGVLSLAKAAGAIPFRYGETLSGGELLGSSWYELYDKIAAGEVAGIRID